MWLGDTVRLGYVNVNVMQSSFIYVCMEQNDQYGCIMRESQSTPCSPSCSVFPEATMQPFLNPNHNATLLYSKPQYNPSFSQATMQPFFITSHNATLLLPTPQCNPPLSQVTMQPFFFTSHNATFLYHNPQCNPFL